MEERASLPAFSETLNAATAENVEQMSDSVTEIYRQHSRGFRHDYTKRFQLLDIDMQETTHDFVLASGLPCGKKSELASKWLSEVQTFLSGYFAKQKNKRGRQLGRVVASRYHEVLTSKLYDGKTKLKQACKPLVCAAEKILGLDCDKRQRTIIRTDAGDSDINFILSQGSCIPLHRPSGYLFITKAFSWRRAQKVCHSVKTWHKDPKVEGREVGLATSPHPYFLETIQIGVRSKKKNGKYSYHLLVTNSQFQQLYYLPKIWHDSPQPILWFAVGVYDLRGGGCETEFKKRNKKKFTAQQMLVLLAVRRSRPLLFADLAHNLCIWALAMKSSKFVHIGILRLVRDVFTISGKIELDDYGNINRIILNNKDPFALHFKQAIQTLMNGITVNLGEI